jgi:Tfp pilus assembly protein PilN
MPSAKDYINLLPPEEKKSSLIMSRGGLVALLFVLVWIGMFGWQAKRYWEADRRLATLQGQRQALQKQANVMLKELGIATTAGSNPERAALVQNLLDDRVLWSEVFKQFSQIVPRGLWFDGLEGNTTGTVEIKIRGGAFTYIAVAEFISAMDRSGYFENPHLSYAQKAVVQGQEVVRFEIISGVKKNRGAGDGR